jgi:hypothetical protein
MEKAGRTVTHVRGVGASPTLKWAGPRDQLVTDAEQEQKDDQHKRCAEQPEQDQDHLRVLLYIRVVRSDATGVLPKPVERVR